MRIKQYEIVNINEDSSSFTSDHFWESVPSLAIEKYLWVFNNYRPKVEVKVCYSDKNLFVHFRTYEKEIKVVYTDINDPVHKDSCVEFFVNLFPNKTRKYFNFELNAIGTIHVGFGAVGKRARLSAEDIETIEINSSLSDPVYGEYGSDHWDIIYKIPLSIFEKYYDEKFDGGEAKGNFYKCGDETSFEHYGVWNLIDSSKPNFHLPQFFGDLIFLEN